MRQQAWSVDTHRRASPAHRPRGLGTRVARRMHGGPTATIGGTPGATTPGNLSTRAAASPGRLMIDESSDSAEMEGLQGSDEDLEEDDTVRARQEAMNARHPFGLPIWKPALYKKSRSVTRAAFLALPRAAAAVGDSVFEARQYHVDAVGGLVADGCVSGGLGGPCMWCRGAGGTMRGLRRGSGGICFGRLEDTWSALRIMYMRVTGALWSDAEHEEAPLLGQASEGVSAEVRHKQFRRHSVLGRAGVLRAAGAGGESASDCCVGAVVVRGVLHPDGQADPHAVAVSLARPSGPALPVGRPADGAGSAGRRGSAGGAAGAERSCSVQTEAVGWYYYKYTVDGVNILFYNMLSVAAFVLFAAFVLAPMTHHQHPTGAARCAVPHVSGVDGAAGVFYRAGGELD
ncbi:hypothetical protein DL89DRAFT_45898 [Linderina pennispora]|uniref:Uncharacterized protein n=1 Tax=Linderina pennispora TaxID=61395 RepID=A0A1Y1W1T5_9FUNG|nr:uncharacterized protein DL89DRAFT_45898 [Linderina pennispora]ORX67509.1 hypothetical protein DL89DRAFT_45898 [Linderina pennispora]